MKKKLLTLLCVLTCVLGLTACGAESVPTAIEQNNMNNCETLAYYSLQLAMNYGSQASELFGSYNKEEMAEIYSELIYNTTGQIAPEAELGAFNGLLTTYAQMESDMGGVKDFGDFTSEVNGKEIVVSIPVYGNECDGIITFTFSNDIFCRFKEGECTAKTSLKQKLEEAGTHMGTAALNTLLGMGSVFIVLILIIFIISSFELLKKDDKKKEVKKVEAPSNVSEAEVELADDSELVAVITAAIAAFESANGGSSDGFVVRSIKKANRRK